MANRRTWAVYIANVYYLNGLNCSNIVAREDAGGDTILWQEERMTAFLARTWFIWWPVAVVVITRWFQVATANDGSMVSSPNDNGARSRAPEIDSNAVGV
jgi:hypothetical protein